MSPQNQKPLIHSCKIKPVLDNSVPVLKENTGSVCNKRFTVHSTGGLADHACRSYFVQSRFQPRLRIQWPKPKGILQWSPPFDMSSIRHFLYFLANNTTPVSLQRWSTQQHFKSPICLFSPSPVIFWLQAKTLNPRHIINFPLILCCPSQASVGSGRGS